MNTPTFLQCISAVIAFTLSNAVWPAVSRQEYDALIIDARAGNHEPALMMLRQHAIDHPQDLRAVYDHVLIASWANLSDEAIVAYEALESAPNRPPANVLEAVARAYRDTQRWDPALAHYRQGQRLFPAQIRFAVGDRKSTRLNSSH